MKVDNVEYRVQSMFYDGDVHYHIEKRVDGGKWKMMFGGMTSYKEAHELVKHPEWIEAKMRGYNRTKWMIVAIVAAGILYWIFNPESF